MRARSGSGATLFLWRVRKRQSQFPHWVIFHCELTEEWFNVVKQLSAPHEVFEKVSARASTQHDISFWFCQDIETHCSQNQLFFTYFQKSTLLVLTVKELNSID
jgi:hypothetical protein